jgi:hypothetical protein
MPTGAPAAQAVYQFDGTAESLDDRTGNGFNLTKIAGGALSYLSVEGITGLDFNDDIELQAPDSAALRHVGALTIELII